MLDIKDANSMILVLARRCQLLCTNDAATNVMTYYDWLEDVVREINEGWQTKEVSEWDKEN